MFYKNYLLLVIFFATNSINHLNSKHVITAGGAQMDIFIRCNSNEANLNTLSGQKIEIQNPSEFYSCGGGAVNTSIGLKRLGFYVSPFIKLGKDERSQIFLKKLDAEGINLNLINFSQECGTGVSYIIPSPDRDNCIFVYRGSNMRIKKEDIPQKELSRANLLYITSLNGDSQDALLNLTQESKKNNVLIAMNPGKQQLVNFKKDFLESLKNVDILILNNLESKILMNNLINNNQDLKNKIINTKSIPTSSNGPILLRSQLRINNFKFTIKQIFKTLLELGPKIIVITNGSDGVYAVAKNKIYYHPSIPTDVVSTTGAGDAFGSTFVGTLIKTNQTIEDAIKNQTIENAICYGVLNSASVVNYMDTNKGLLNQEELNIKSKKIDKNLLQKFEL